MDADHRAGIGLVEHVALAQQLLGTLLAQDRPAVDAAGHLEADARRQVRLDDAGDDIDRGALRRHDQMDAGGAALLRQPLDQHFDFLAHGDHQIGQLVDDQHDQRQRFVIELLFLVELLAGFGVEAGLYAAAERLALLDRLADLLVEAGDIARIDRRHHPVAPLHLLDRPFECAHRFVRLGHHRAEQVGDVVIAFQLEHLGVDQDQPAFVGREAIEQRQQDGVQSDRLARTGGARDQQMRHGRQIGDDRFACDILAEDHRQAALMVDECGRIGELFVADHLAIRIGQFDADHRLARDRRHARADRRHVARDILGQPDHAAGLDARRGFELVHGDHRPRAHRSDLALDVEIVEHVFEQPRIAFERHLVELGRGMIGRIVEQVVARQLVIGEHVALLGLGRPWLNRGRRRIGDFGCAARLVQWHRLRLVVLGRFGRALLLLRRERQVELGQLRLAFHEVGQGEELRPVDREDTGDQRDAAAQRDQGEDQHDPAGECATEALRHRFDPQPAELAEQPTDTCRQTAGGGIENQCQHCVEQRDRGEQHGDRAPPAAGRFLLVLALDPGPQPPRGDIEQRQQQHCGQAEEIERAFARPGPAGAHPVADVRPAGRGRGAGIGLGVARQRQRQENEQREQHSGARHMRGTAEGAAKRRAPIGCCACARSHVGSPDPLRARSMNPRGLRRQAAFVEPSPSIAPQRGQSSSRARSWVMPPSAMTGTGDLSANA